MSESGDTQISSLGWVRDEVNKSLDEARASLEAYVDSGDEADAADLQRCHELVQQVRGTLQMVQLQGALLLTEEMLHLLDALFASSEKIADRTAAYEALMRAILQLPDYINKVQSGQTDAAIVLLPLINDLRAAYGEGAVVAQALFSPHFNGILPPEMAAVTSFKGGDLSALIKGSRHQVHLSMLGLFRDKNVETSLNKIIELYLQFCVAAHSEPIKQLYWITAALCEGIRDGGLNIDALPVKPLLGQVDRQSKMIIDDGEEKLAAEPPFELIRILLYYVACSSSQGEHVIEISKAFRLKEYLPDEQELQKLREKLTAPGPEVMQTVVQGVEQQLERAHDMLDIYNRTGEQDNKRLQQMVEALHNVAGTVAMVGEVDLQASINEYCDNIEALINGDKTAEEAGMPGMADFILRVDIAVKELISDKHTVNDTGPSLTSTTGVWDIKQAVVKESMANMSTAKDIISAFAESPDTDREQLATVTGLLQQIAGSLKIASLDRASDIIYALRSYIDQELIKAGRTPDEQELGSLAEAVSSADYYLEAVIDELPNKDTALELAEAALDLLGFSTMDVSQELEELAENLPDEDSGITVVEEDSDLLESLTDDLEKEYGADNAADETRTIELSPEALARVYENEGALDDIPLEQTFSEVEEEAADVEEIEITPPQESEEEMSLRMANEAEAMDLGDLPAIEAVEEMPDGEIEEVSLDALVESEEDMQSRVREELENTGEVEVVAGTIEVDDIEAEIEDFNLEDTGEVEQVSAEIEVEDIEDSGLEYEAISDAKINDVDVSEAVDDQSYDVPLVEVESSATSNDAMGESPLGDDLDDEIIDIFLEEAEEVLAEIRHHFPVWRNSPNNVDSLSIVRRSFHTLKGSGRMVGANQVGEIAWAIENLLNRIIDNSVNASSEVMDVISKVVDVLPVMIGQLTGGAAPDVDIQQLLAVANTLAKGNPMAVSQDGGETPMDTDSTQKKNHNLAASEEGSASSSDSSDVSSPLDSEELRQVYTEETNEHLQGLRAFIERCRTDEGSCKLQDAEVVIIHTLHGGAATVDAPQGLRKIFDILEPLAILFSNHGIVVDEPLLDMCGRIINQVQLFLDDVNSSEQTYILDIELLEELQLLFQQKKDLLGATTTSLDILNVVPDGSGAAENEESSDVVVLDEISSSLEDLHDLMSPDIEMIDVNGNEPEDEEVDPEILDIFLDEADELLASIEQTLDDWQNDQKNQQLLISVQRDIHTLKGGARMVSQTALADIGHAMESLLTAVVDGQVAVTDSMFSTLNLARDTLQDIYEDLRGGKLNASTDADLVARLESLRRTQATEEVITENIDTSDELPISHDDTEESDDEVELTSIFMEEAGELLESIDQTLDDWQNDEDNKDLVIQLQRDIHTLKGGARMVGLTGIGDLGHALETILTAVVDGHLEVSRPLIDGMHEVKDELQAMYEAVQQGKGDSETSEGTLKTLQRLRTGGELLIESVTDNNVAEEFTPSNIMPAFEDDSRTVLLEDSGNFDVTPSIPLDAITDDGTSLTTIVASKEKADSKSRINRDKRADARVEHETIRVRSDLIDGLVNLAGETNIFRSRLEQQSSSFRFSLSELDQTVLRLQGQLKKMEAETDAQILFRHEKEMDNPDNENFDPLEMDRYSTMQQLSRSLVESVGDLKSLQDMLGGLTRDSELLLLQQGRVNSELQNKLMQSRVVPFAATMASRLRRITRQTCQQLGKQAELKILGANEEMDRHILDRMIAPLEHMLRNSIAHGIESPVVRKSLGKPETGTVTISVGREGGEILIQVADDGAGLDTDVIRRKAELKGLIIENADMNDEEIMQLVLMPGFSTAESISQISGRGVGMDIVNNELRQLGGSLHIESVAGRGAELTVRLPFTLSITEALLVRVANDLYAIPLSSIEGVSRFGRQEAEKLVDNEDSNYQYGGENYRLSFLGQLLGRPSAAGETDEVRPAIILVRAAGHRVGFYIDELLGHHEIVVKSLGVQVGSINGMAGGTILGDGRVALILDVPALVRMVGAEHGMSETHLARVMEAPESVKLTVMVVDDSITVRRVTTRLLERHEMQVVTAKDGVDAVAKLEEIVPDVMLLDVEMPRMDGYELATHIRNDARFKDVPIVMITSRTGDKHRERAEAIGVNRYLGKPYQEIDLLNNINQVLEER